MKREFDAKTKQITESEVIPSKAEMMDKINISLKTAPERGFGGPTGKELFNDNNG